ncbi:methyltransferase family protein [Paraburkholderia aromaticivorans]|uniref:methyltransferase family protein n=1 Tax=Paraburkholderia aromaticivorans TaxID=2026199 RepID=UPI001455EB1E|nr:isoprenylcysteine carboxylmethyltransferase family protein [Paraburkholderia aromaticivorans]
MKPEILGTAGVPAVSISFDGPAPVPPSPPRVRLTRRQLGIEIALRVFSVTALLSFLASALFQFMKNPARITLLLLVVTALLDIGLVVSTRIARERDWAPLSVAMTVFGTFYYLAFRIDPGYHLIPEAVAVALQITGILIQICAKLTLRRSFGFLPANRGVVVGGPYRIVRHPIYFGYVIRDLGFLLPNFGIQNAAVLAVHLGVQVCRVVREERVLSKDSSYREYMSRVRYRLIVGVF